MDSKEPKRPTISPHAVAWGRTVPAAADSPIFKAGWVIGGRVGAESSLPTGTVTYVAPTMGDTAKVHPSIDSAAAEGMT